MKTLHRTSYRFIFEYLKFASSIAELSLLLNLLEHGVACLQHSAVLVPNHREKGLNVRSVSLDLEPIVISLGS